MKLRERAFKQFKSPVLNVLKYKNPAFGGHLMRQCFSSVLPTHFFFHIPRNVKKSGTI